MHSFFVEEDDRPAAGTVAPAVWFAYTQNRKGEHPQRHLARYRGILQADAYGGCQAIYGTAQVIEAAGWAHARRKFYELHQARPSTVTAEALRRSDTMRAPSSSGRALLVSLAFHPAIPGRNCL